MSEEIQPVLNDETIYRKRSRAGEGLPPIGPRGDQLELLEQDREHLLYVMKGGGKNLGSIGCFAVMWNLITWTVATVMLGAFLKGEMKGDNAIPLFAVGIILLFLGVGIGFIYFWVYMKFGRTLLIVQPGMIGLQNDLFGWKKMKTLTLNPGDFGKLSVAYEQNDVPVHQIEFKNGGGKLTFGVGLDPESQDRLLDEIHKFLGVEGEEIEQIGLADPSGFSGTEQEALDSLQQHGLEVLEEQRGEILVRISPRKTTKNFFAGFGCLTVFALFWEGFVIFWTLGAAQSSVVFALFSIPFHIVGLGISGLLLFMLLGKSEIRLSRSECSVKWSCLGIFWTSRCAADVVEEFKVVRSESRRVGDLRRRRAANVSDETGSMVLIARRSEGGDLKLHFGSDQWMLALAAYLNTRLSALRKL